jgi:tetratricopeptide (TPR) repeat protein
MTLLALAGAGLGFYLFALHKWHAAQLAVEHERTVEARSHLDFCLMVWPRSIPLHLLAARAAWQGGDLERSEALLNRCLKLQQGATEEIQLEFLLLRAQAGEIDEVAPALLEYVEKNSSNLPLILESMARAYMRSLQYGAAYACLNRWIEAAPDTARAYHYRGWVTERLDSAKEALADYERALTLDPDLAPVRLRVAEMLLEDTRSLEALPHLERLTKQYPTRPDIMARMGHCYLLQGRNEDARKLLVAAVQLLPDDAALLHNLAKLELQEKKWAEAEAWLRHALEVDRADTEALYSLASALRFQGRNDEAAAVLERHTEMTAVLERANRMLRAEARHPSTTPVGPSELGSLLIRLGQEQLGVHWMEKALSLDPAHQPTHQALAAYYQSKGDTQKAMAHRTWLPPDQEKKAAAP